MRFLLMIIIAILVGIWTSSVLWAVITLFLLMALWIACVMLGMLFIAVGLLRVSQAQAKILPRKF